MIIEIKNRYHGKKPYRYVRCPKVDSEIDFDHSCWGCAERGSWAGGFDKINCNAVVLGSRADLYMERGEK